MNLKDMQHLLDAVKQVDKAIYELCKTAKYTRLHVVQVAALAEYREQIITEFEERHGVEVER